MNSEVTMRTEVSYLPNFVVSVESRNKDRKRSGVSTSSACEVKCHTQLVCGEPQAVLRFRMSSRDMISEERGVMNRTLLQPRIHDLKMRLRDITDNIDSTERMM
jgi:hypothetical protein